MPADPPDCSSYISAVARTGAAPLPSIVVTVPSGCRMTHHATPPSPLVVGSTTPIANAAATAASTALPPSRRMRAPTSAASGCSAVIIAPDDAASLFWTSHSLRVAIAVIFDLAVGDPSARPNADSGYAACGMATRDPAEGLVGAGTGATVAKLGTGRAPGGLAVASVPAGDATVSAVVVVNALGDVW